MMFSRVNLFYLSTASLGIMGSGVISGYFLYNHWKNQDVKFPNKYAPVKNMVKVEKEKSPQYTVHNETGNNVNDEIDIYLLPEGKSKSSYRIEDFIDNTFSY